MRHYLFGFGFSILCMLTGSVLTLYVLSPSGASGLRKPPEIVTWDQQFEEVMHAIEQVESGGDPSVVNEAERAIGILQVTPIMVDDVNRIAGLSLFRHSDMYDPEAARQVFMIYSRHYSLNQPMEVIARRWNGGPTGDRKQATLPYWEKVKAELDRSRK